MKIKPTYILAGVGAMLTLLMGGCKDDSLASGNSTLDDNDKIVVRADTFALASSLIEAERISCTSDSFLLGDVDNMYGTVHADILTQFACPLGFEYPANAIVDSACLYIYYKNWYGDPHSPMDISVYEMDRATFAYSDRLYTDIDVSQYWSGDKATSVMRSKCLIMAGQPTDSISTSSSSSTTYTYFIRIPLCEEFTQRLFTAKDFTSQEAFCEEFKGLYITSEFGSSVMLNVSNVSLSMFYHYTYQKAGRDTTISDGKTYYANTEVRHANSIKYYNSQIELIKTVKDEYNFVASPANIFTSIDIPLAQLTDSIRAKVGNKRAYVNRAQIYIEVLNNANWEFVLDKRDQWAKPADNMLLIREDAIERFFSSSELPTDTCAILSTLTVALDSLGYSHQYYTYDLSTLLTQQLREKTQTDTLHMVLVPVDVEYTNVSNSYYGYSSSSNTMTAVGHKQGVTSTIIRSAHNVADPMDLEVVYSGF